MIRSLKKLGSSEESSRIQDYTQNALAPLLKSLVVDGLLIKDVELVTGVNEVPHKLGRQFQGWIISDKTGTADIWRVPTNLETRLLTLEADADVTISLWVY